MDIERSKTITINKNCLMKHTGRYSFVIVVYNTHLKPGQQNQKPVIFNWRYISLYYINFIESLINLKSGIK